MEHRQADIRSIFSWCLFDWANSAFPSIVTTFIFAAYFTEKVAANKIIGTSLWGDAIAIAGLLIAIVSPPLGAIADNSGRRKPWIGFFSLLCVISCAGLWFAEPNPSAITITLTCVVLGTVGLEVGMVFYNAMLRDIAPSSYLGRISGWAWGLGYFGGLASLSIALFIFVQGHGHLFGMHLNPTTSEDIRICGPLAAIWFLVFGWPLFVFVPDRPSTKLPLITAMKRGLNTLLQTILQLKHHREIMKFLLARMLYIDALNTLFAFGGIYAAGVFHLTIKAVLLLGITLNIFAGTGSGVFAWLDDAKGSKLTILISITLLFFSCSGMILTHSLPVFLGLALILSLCVGPIQAASRSMMVRMAPPQLITEMFGLFAFSGKATAFVGPWLLGYITYLTHSQRLGMASAMLFLVAGGSLLLFVKNIR